MEQQSRCEAVQHMEWQSRWQAELDGAVVKLAGQ